MYKLLKEKLNLEANKYKVLVLKRNFHVNRQYCDYFKFGFSWSGIVNKPSPLYLMCGENVK